jgi:hypothetical protein
MSIAAVPKCGIVLITLAVATTVACNAGSTTSGAIGSSGRTQPPTGASTTHESSTPPSTDDGSGSTTTTLTETNDTAPISFSLDLVGPVAFADRYSVRLSVDDTIYTNGFCGLDGESTRCLASELYTWDLPAVPLGSTLDWYYTRGGSESFDFATASNVTLSGGLQVAARCIYRDSTTGPTCERTA